MRQIQTHLLVSPLTLYHFSILFTGLKTLPTTLFSNRIPLFDRVYTHKYFPVTRSLTISYPSPDLWSALASFDARLTLVSSLASCFASLVLIWVSLFYATLL